MPDLRNSPTASPPAPWYAAWGPVFAIAEALSGLFLLATRRGDERHRARVHWRALRLRRRLQFIARTAGRELVIVALVEGLGDLVAAEPALRAIRRRHPDALIVHVVGRPWLPLTAGHPAVDRHEIVNCLSEWYLAAGRTGGIEYDLHIPGRVCDRCQSIVRPTPPATPGIDITNYFRHGSLLEVFSKVGGIDLRGIDPQPRLYVEPSSLETPERPTALPPRYAVIHAASNQPERDWTKEGWEQVISALWKEGLPVAEVGLQPTLKGSGAIDLTGVPLTRTISIIRGAALFLGVDSGPAHVANAAGTPGVVLLGRYAGFESRMPFTGGYAEGTTGTVINHPGPLSELPAQRIVEAALARLSLSRQPTARGLVAPAEELPDREPLARG